MGDNRNSNWNMNFQRGGRGNRRGSFLGGRGNFRGNSGKRGNFGQWGSRQHADFRNSNSSQHWKNKTKRDSPGKRLSEDDIGVTEYISKHEGFLGIIKSRYSDFQVSEINEEGQVAKLTDLAIPQPPEDAEVIEDEDLLFCKYNLEILPMETWDNINRIATAAEVEPTDIVEIDATNMTKEQRTKIHEAVKKAFGESIVSSTYNFGEGKFVRFERFRKGVRIDTRVKWKWPGEYVYFIVHKENCDTMEAASRIAERLRLNIKPSMIGYAGTKDRRAKTSQWFSLRKVDPRKVGNACRDMRDLRIGNFDFKPKGLKLGMLKGNKFQIALRNVTAPEETVNEACENLSEKGFINYYGLQRFGSRVETPTYQIGLQLLQGNFKEAIESILSARGAAEGLLQTYRRAGPAAALRHCPRLSAETRLIKALAQQPNNFVDALNKLARNTRLLYLHSYQSLIWNKAVSERIKRFGLKPAVGDLVSLNTEEIKEEIDGGFVDADDEENEEETDSETSSNPEQDTENTQTAESSPETPKDEKQKIPVKVLTQEDVDSGKYSMFDIIMPLPGYIIEYPPNMKEYYEELLKKDGLALELRHKIKSYSMSGAYRHVVIRVSDAHWKIVRYSDPYADLILSDWDLLQGNKKEGFLEDGKYKALLITFTLPSSCYATMALRELLKVDTASDNQALQNNYHKKKDETEKEKHQEETTQESDTQIKTESEGSLADKTVENEEVEVKKEVEENRTEKRPTEDEVDVANKKLKQEENTQSIDN